MPFQFKSSTDDLDALHAAVNKRGNTAHVDKETLRRVLIDFGDLCAVLAKKPLTRLPEL